MDTFDIVELSLGLMLACGMWGPLIVKFCKKQWNEINQPPIK